MGEYKTNLGPFVQWNILQQQKGTNYWYRQQSFTPKCFMLQWKRPGSKGCMSYDSKYITFSENRSLAWESRSAFAWGWLQKASMREFEGLFRSFGAHWQDSGWWWWPSNQSCRGGNPRHWGTEGPLMRCLTQPEGFSEEGASELRLTGCAGVRQVKSLPGHGNGMNRGPEVRHSGNRVAFIWLIIEIFFFFEIHPFFFFFSLLAAQRDWRGLSSPTRDWTVTLGSESAES